MNSGGRHQIGMVAAIRLELVAAIIGIRTSTSRSKTQQGIWARWNRDTHSQARSSFAAERKTEGVLEISQPPGSTARKGGNFREALGERPTGATPIQTVEPPRGDADGHRPTLPRQIVQ